jgi:hypothetical protein
VFWEYFFEDDVFVARDAVGKFVVFDPLAAKQVPEDDFVRRLWFNLLQHTPMNMRQIPIIAPQIYPSYTIRPPQSQGWIRIPRHDFRFFSPSICGSAKASSRNGAEGLGQAQAWIRG